MPLAQDGQMEVLPPTLMLLIGLVLLFAAVGITKNSAAIDRWFCGHVRRLQAVYVLALVFGLFGFVVIARAGMMEGWSFDRVALAIGGFTIIAAGRAAAGVMARKKRDLRRRETEDQGARLSARPPTHPHARDRSSDAE